jgi:hypothetical protein
VRERPAEEECVTVGLGVCNDGGTNRTAAAYVFDDDHAKYSFHLIRPRSSDGVECTARRKRNDEPDRTGWIALRVRNAGGGRQRSNAGSQL